MTEKIYPCDHHGICPFDTGGTISCRDLCGLGVDEDKPEYEGLVPEEE